MLHKRSITLLMLAGVFVLLLAALLITEHAGEGVGTSEPVQYVLEGLNVDDVRLVRVERVADGMATLMERDEDNLWVIASTAHYREALAEDGTLQELLTDQQAAGQVARFLTVLSTRTGFSAQRDAADLEGFGLAPLPQYLVRFEMIDGARYVLEIGETNPQRNAYYVNVRGEPTVYLALKSSVDGLIDIVDEPPYLEETPTPTLTPTETSTPTQTFTPTPTPEHSPTPTPTSSPTTTPTEGPSPTYTLTHTLTPTTTPTPTLTRTSTSTPTASPTVTQTPEGFVPTASLTATQTVVPTSVLTPLPPTPTETPTDTLTPQETTPESE
jgi:hypothetical protein